MLILNKSDATLQFVDAASFEKSVSMSEGPSGILNDAGWETCVAYAGAKEVAVIDTPTFSVSHLIDSGNVPDGLAYAP